MRPPIRPSSFFYHPFDSILGTVASIRILRALSLHQDVMSAPMIAQRTGMVVAGIHRALKRLVDANAVDPVGDPRRPHYRLQQNNPLVTHLATLFDAEAKRSDQFIQQLRDAAIALQPPLAAVWLIGSVARGEDSMTSDLDVVMVSPGTVRTGFKLFNTAIHDAGRAIGFQASILTMTKREVAQHAKSNDKWWKNLVADAVPIVGPAPGVLFNG